MSLRINVSQSWSNPGNTVSGTVSLSGEQDVDIRVLNICFVGCCETQDLVLYQDDFVPVDGRVPLFEYMQVLFQGPRTLQLVISGLVLLAQYIATRLGFTTKQCLITWY